MMRPKHELFAREVARGRSYRQSAIYAGYRESAAQATGCRLANKPAIAQRIKELIAENAKDTTLRDLQHDLRSSGNKVVYVLVPAGVA